MLAERENKIIGMIYDAALNPILWESVLADIVDFTGSSTAIFTATDQLSADYDFTFSFNISDECLQIYQNEQIKVLDMRLHTPHWETKELGDTIATTFVPYANMSDTTDEYIFYEKCAKPTNITYVTAVLLERSIYSWAVFAIHRSPQLAEYSLYEEQILQRLGVHIRRALQIYRQINILKRERNSIYQILDQFKIGVLLLNEQSCLSYTNSLSRGVLEKSSLLQIDKKNHLKVPKVFQEKLTHLISSALFKNSDQLTETGGVMVLFDDKTDESLMLSVLPFTENEFSYQKQVIIFITPKKHSQYLEKDYLIQKYKLTNRELEVCDFFVNGMNLEQISEEMGITLSSLRTYLKSIFTKTKCNSQAELMRLLMGASVGFEHI